MNYIMILLGSGCRGETVNAVMKLAVSYHAMSVYIYIYIYTYIYIYICVHMCIEQ